MDQFQTLIIAILLIAGTLVGIRYNIFPEGMYKKPKDDIKQKKKEKEFDNQFKPGFRNF